MPTAYLTWVLAWHAHFSLSFRYSCIDLTCHEGVQSSPMRIAPADPGPIAIKSQEPRRTGQHAGPRRGRVWSRVGGVSPGLGGSLSAALSQEGQHS